MGVDETTVRIDRHDPHVFKPTFLLPRCYQDRTNQAPDCPCSVRELVPTEPEKVQKQGVVFGETMRLVGESRDE